MNRPARRVRPGFFRAAPVSATALALAALSALAGCGGAGPYGYSRQYSYLGDEEHYAHAQNANLEAIYDEVRRMPDRYQGQVLSWFGVVTGVETQPDGTSKVALQIRTHQDRHLCSDETESSCRVTVSEANGGPFTAVVRLSQEDQSGTNRVQIGGLLRVYGTLVPNEYDAQGGPVIQTQYYRHWPRGQYVTTAARATYLH